MSDDADDDDDLDDEDPEPVGWDAIDSALAPIYHGREPMHYGTVVPMMLGGNDPLQGISVYKNLEPAPHYHYVTYGFSELYDKEADDPDVSGYGFEMTFRLACDADAPDDPPKWPLNLLQNIARYVFRTGNAFDARHHMTCNGPIALGEETQITAIMLLLDPQLQEMDTANGHVKFLQIVGLCDDEYELIQAGYFDPIASRVSNLTPLAITDIFRPSILEDEITRNEITALEPDVKQTEIYGTVAEWEESKKSLTLKIGANLIPQLKSILKGRVAKGDPIAVFGKGSGIVFEPGEANGWKVEEKLMIVSLAGDLALQLADRLEAVRGEYTCDEFPALKLNVVPIEIKDGDGNVIKTVG